jgi:hypothetical protein
MIPAQPLIPESVVPTLAILCLGWGAIAMGALGIESVEGSASLQELITGAVGSILLGVGFLFFLLWCGAFV